MLDAVAGKSTNKKLNVKIFRTFSLAVHPASLCAACLWQPSLWQRPQRVVSP
jgi:hypothetical protein